MTKKFRGQNVDFGDHGTMDGTMAPWHHGTMVPCPPPIWGGENVVFYDEILKKWARIFWTWKKLFFRLNPLFPPLEVGRPLEKKAWRLVQKMTKLRTKSSGARMFVFSGEGLVLGVDLCDS